MKYLTKWWSVLFTIAVFASLKISNPDFLQSITYAYYDYLQQKQEKQLVQDIVLVNIDEEAIKKEGQYPWPRQTIAKYLDKSPDSSLSVFTMIWSEKDRFQGDDQLAQSLMMKPTILSAAPTKQTTGGTGIHVGVSTFGTGNDNFLTYPGLLVPIEELASMAYGVGTTAAEPDYPTGVVRRAPVVIKTQDKLYPSVAMEVLRVFAGEPSYQLKINELGAEWIRMGTQPPVSVQPTGELLISFWNQFEQISILDPLPEGKVLIFGVTAEGVANPIATPMGAMYPHEVQAHLVQTLLSGVEIQIPYWTPIAELGLLVLLCLGILVAVYTLPTVPGLLVCLVLAASSSAISHYFWTDRLVFVDATLCSLASFLIFAQCSFNKYYITFQQKRQIKKQFETYLDPRQVYLLQKDPSLLKLGGERKDMTFLFMDICGFTPVSEYYKNNNDPEGLVELINMYLDTMTQIILKNGGTIDKYMGDCIMAFWNAPLPCEDHETKAVITAREISQAADELIKQLEEKGLPRIDVGIGINTGTCIVGNMGSKTRFDYSVIGDAVNLASRLEGQTRNYDGVRVLLSSSTAERVQGQSVVRVDSIQVKGKSESIDVFTLA